jgi:hypothetical protein
MASDVSQTGEFTLVINAEERAELLRLLEQSLKDTRVEVHRTHTPDFRNQVLQEENLLRSLLSKIQRCGS